MSAAESPVETFSFDGTSVSYSSSEDKQAPPESDEPLLKPNPRRFVLFPIEYPQIWQMYKKAEPSFWTAEEIELRAEISDWRTKLNDDERFFTSRVLAFFASSDFIINENLAKRFATEVQIPEARWYVT